MTLPVLIIGAGPVGMTLASELTRYGVSVRVVDKAMARTDKSKAIILWSRTLELLDRGGPDGATPFVAAGLKATAVNLIAAGGPIGRIELGDVHSPHPYGLMLPQSDTERLLEERLAGQGIMVDRGVELASFTHGPAGVDAVLRHADGREEQVAAGWLVGCDGAHSAVRHGLQAPFVGETLDSDWILADVHLRDCPVPAHEAAIYWHRDGVFLLFPIAPGRYRLLADLPPSGAAHPPTPTLDEVQAITDRRGPAGTTLFDPVWLAGFRINGRKVASYRHGRTFLAGDAAHIHSPAGGQGMNTGMQDAVNLAWKLALVDRGTCRDSLLDSYSPERSHVGDQVLKGAERLTKVATLKNPVAQRLRNLARPRAARPAARGACGGRQHERDHNRLPAQPAERPWAARRADSRVSGSPPSRGSAPAGRRTRRSSPCSRRLGPRRVSCCAASPACSTRRSRPPFPCGRDLAGATGRLRCHSRVGRAGWLGRGW